ncbi:MAG: hypothetical protein IJM35_05220 [Bacteroidales bacterium]|nr:hypothetical protein [Bacteroidales bacterium]
MILHEELLGQMMSDLGLNTPFVKGQSITIKNCWHFSTDGNHVDQLFYDGNDFIAGMNRVYILAKKYSIIILAFSLMDTHVHFVLYGKLEDCQGFMHEFVRLTSRHIATVHHDNNKMLGVPVNYQTVDSDRYLKTVICYTVKNAPTGGIPFMGWDYPWSSGPLYFRKPGMWSSPLWTTDGIKHNLDDRITVQRKMLNTRKRQDKSVIMMGPLVFPGEYVAYETVEDVFKTCKSYNYFMSSTRDDMVDSRDGIISHLCIPMQEMRQHKNELCAAMFGVRTVKALDTSKRIRLARALHSRYNSSVKQIARLCGLLYDEVKNMV